MIVTNISHGFGNQLFQYAAGYAAARRAGTTLGLDTRYFRKATDRTFQLDRLAITAPRISTVREAALRLAVKLPESPAGRVMRSLLGVGPLKIVLERDMAYEPGVFDAGKSALLVGFWQDERYFADYADDIRREFTFKTPPNAYNQGIIDQMRQQTSICVHVRRGDYVVPNSTLPACSLDYYREALARMTATVPNARYFVFSDDPEWTRANLVLPDGSVFVTGNVGVSDTDDLRLMSHGDHFVIANSTFSWWSAWLSASPGKTVIAPSPWFRPGIGTEAIVPSRWTRIERAID